MIRRHTVVAPLWPSRGRCDAPRRDAMRLDAMRCALTASSCEIRGSREGGVQKAEGRRQKAEGRRQKAEGRRQKAQGTRHKADARVGYRDTCIGVCPEVVTGDWRLVRVRVRVRERSRGISCPLLCHVPDNDKQVGPKGPKNLPTARCRSLLAPVQWRSWCCQ
ncbi:uncharacterized protein VDAG_10304 [Verticillium dahliae VdLs.17]|uniref:Uncharacterized protein n=1 Tax=Verticillium dahliae (strain VdLs.17 / ATCC MYA-4575 / FGSC 10137) TaxID=498257 RepID=G2XJP1_VERDV|nr:uncharacterized protein VDAG_10304 [Verticillium dahliae VdLs.17]EGY20744.1 hypothetical protein VDAG_10304 [Verticillium dahliae VdLs.17]